jgi:hypothetical protein
VVVEVVDVVVVEVVDVVVVEVVDVVVVVAQLHDEAHTGWFAAAAQLAVQSLLQNERPNQMATHCGQVEMLQPPPECAEQQLQMLGPSTQVAHSPQVPGLQAGWGDP